MSKGGGGIVALSDVSGPRSDVRVYIRQREVERGGVHVMTAEAVEVQVAVGDSIWR